MDRIEIRGLSVMTVVGVLPHERESAQPVEIDLDLVLDPRDAGSSDELGDTAGYGEMAERVATLVRGSKDHLLERAISFVQGWGVEIAMLLDIADRFGLHSIAEVDLGIRHHRHRTLEALSIQAAEVMATFLSRVGRGCALDTAGLRHAAGSTIPLNLRERAPASIVRRTAGAVKSAQASGDE